MKNDYKSRFKILKGGKISLIVSALIISSFTSDFKAAEIEIDTDNTTQTVSTNYSSGKDNVIQIDANDVTLIINKDVELKSDNHVIYTYNTIDNLSITNKGNIISENNNGINITNNLYNNSSIINEGFIKGKIGIDAYGGDINIVNSKDAIIEAETEGIRIQESMQGTNSIKNLGTINISSNSSEETSAIEVEEMNDNSSIINEGNINLSNSSSQYDTTIIGIKADYLNNSSSIINNGNINDLNSENNFSIGIYARSQQHNVKLINKNTIFFENSNAAIGIVSEYLAEDTTLSNEGDITVKNKEGILPNDYTSGLYIMNIDRNSNVTINNSGKITSSQNGIFIQNPNHQEVSFKASTKGVSAPANKEIINSGSILANSYAIKIIDTNFENLTISNEIDAVLSGNIRAYGNSNNLLENHGNIYLNINDSKYSSNSFEDYEIFTNNFTQSKDGVIQIKVDNSIDANDAKYSQIFVNENLTLEDGTTVDFNVVKNPNENLLVGQTLQNVFYVDGSATSDYNVEKLNITDNSALVNFEPVSTSYGLDFNIVEGKSIADATVPNESNAGEAARVLDKIKDSGNTLDGFISALNSKATDKEVAQAVKETTPVVATALANSSNQVQQTIGSVVSGRQLGIRGISSFRGANSGDDMLSNNNAWYKAFVSKASQDDKDGYDGYDFDSYGFAIGADKEFGNNSRFGLAFVYASGEIDTNNVSQSSDLDIYNLVAYGSTPIFDKDTFLFYQLSLGIQDTKTSRKEHTTNTTATSDFNGKIASASLRLIKNMQLNDNLLFVPTIRGMYTYMKNPSYKESGANNLNLNVDKFSTSSFKLGIGADFEYNLNNSFTLLSNAMINYDLKQSDNSSSSSYAGNSDLAFTTKGMDLSKFSYEAGIGFKTNFSEDVDFRFEYNYEGRDSSFSNQTLSAKISWKF